MEKITTISKLKMTFSGVQTIVYFICVAIKFIFTHKTREVADSL